MELEVRKCVTIREQLFATGKVIYLSLFNTEIDTRFNKFCHSIENGKAQWLAFLELTDAVIHQLHGGEVVVYRGGSCTFPIYWSYMDFQLHLSTNLPITEGKNFSRKYLVAFFTNVYLQSSYEPNTTSITPLGNWRRIKRCSATTFKTDRSIRETVYLHQVNNNFSEEKIADDIEKAFKEYGLLQGKENKSVLELSGGFDSTLAAAAAPAILNGMHGISVEFPYYEFSHEAKTQIEVSAALGIKRSVLDGTLEFPYAPALDVSNFDEPTVFVTGLRHAERVATFASNYGATRLYVGHGGDQLFSTNLLDKDPVSPFKIESGLFSGQAFQIFRSAFVDIKKSPWLQRETGCFVYDACIDVWMKEAYGLTVRTPFTDLLLFKAALGWSHWCHSLAVRPDKSILAKSMGKIIPDAVLNRKGKVAYDGVWLRAYAKHADNISHHFERTASILEYIGLSPHWLLNRVKQVADWQEVSTKEILAAFAISNWLLSRNIVRPQDVTWFD